MNISTQTTSTLSAEDVQARIGKLTASREVDAMDFLLSGKESAKRKKYKMDLVAERMTNVMTSHYVTPAMKFGIEQQPNAEIAYSEKTGRKLLKAKFVDHPTIEFLGATPDAIVDDFSGKFGLVEFKCPTTAKYLQWRLDGIVPEEHRPQMIIQLQCTGLEWCDFCAFDQRMPKDKQLFILRYIPTVEEVENVISHAKQFLQEVDELFDRLNS